MGTENGAGEVDVFCPYKKKKVEIR